MKTYTLNADQSSATFTLFGGQLLSWTHQQQEILWLSELADMSGHNAIRGGVPICFPWFAERGTPKHGFARTSQWQLLELNPDNALLGLQANSDTLTIWPHQFALKLRIELDNSTLKLELNIENTGDQPWQFTGALHSYFSCDSAANLTIAELDGRHFHNSLTGQQQQFNGSQLPNPIDAIVPKLSQLQVSNDLVIQHQGNDSTVIWNPAQHHPADVAPHQQQQFICFESAVAVAPLTLAPNQSHKLSQIIRLQR